MKARELSKALRIVTVISHLPLLHIPFFSASNGNCLLFPLLQFLSFHAQAFSLSLTLFDVLNDFLIGIKLYSRNNYGLFIVCTSLGMFLELALLLGGNQLQKITFS